LDDDTSAQITEMREGCKKGRWHTCWREGLYSLR
jgi:hypothetical protein